MTIGEIAVRIGITASAIRYYEKSGLLAAAPRVSGKRAYEKDVLHELAIIRFAKGAGFTLPEIKQLMRGFPENTPASRRWRKMACAKIEELESALGTIRAMKRMLETVMSCQCRTLAQCASDLAQQPERWQPGTKRNDTRYATSPKRP